MKKAIICLMLALCIGGVLAGCGKKENDTKKAETKKETVKQETEEEYLVIGNETEDAIDILLKNSTGQDITALSVKTSDKTEYPASMMKTGDVLKAGETAELFYTPESTGTADTDAASTDKAINIVYSVQVTLADGKVLELSSFGMEDIKEEAELCLEDEVGFVKYVSKASGDSVSTKEQELGAKAQRDAAEAAAAQAAAEAAAAQAAAEAAAAAQVESYSEETYSGGYTEPAYTEPAQQAPVEEAPAQGSEGCLNPGDVVINPQ